MDLSEMPTDAPSALYVEKVWKEWERVAEKLFRQEELTDEEWDTFIFAGLK